MNLPILVNLVFGASSAAGKLSERRSERSITLLEYSWNLGVVMRKTRSLLLLAMRGGGGNVGG